MVFGITLELYTFLKITVFEITADTKCFINVPLLFKSGHTETSVETPAKCLCAYFMDALLHSLFHIRLRLIKPSFDLLPPKAL